MRSWILIASLSASLLSQSAATAQTAHDFEVQSSKLQVIISDLSRSSDGFKRCEDLLICQVLLGSANAFRANTAAVSTELKLLGCVTDNDKLHSARDLFCRTIIGDMFQEKLVLEGLEKFASATSDSDLILSIHKLSEIMRESTELKKDLVVRLVRLESQHIQ